jgi:chaperone required for assembly of F1-ATPase
MKRFWTTTTAIADGEHFTVLLDAKPLKLPGGRGLSVPYAALAEGIAAEWGAAPQEFSPDDLPLTQLTSTAQDRVRQHREAIIRQLAAYGLNDLLCYRAEGPAPLVAQENEQWDKWLDWARERYGVELLITTGVLPINQPEDTATRFATALDAYTEYGLAALGVLVPALGSLVLGLAVAEGALDAQAASDTAFTDELWQETNWGQDKEAIARRRHVTADVASSQYFLSLCQG